MSLSDALNQSAQYTGSIFHRLGELLILFIVSIIPIVNFIALGYYARIIRDSPSSKSTPKLERYGDMFIEGLKIIVVGIVWAIIIAIIAVVIAIPFVSIAALGGVTSGAFLSAGWIFALGLFIVIFVIIAFLLGIIAYMSIVHMVKKNDFGKAFAFGEIIGMIGKIGWLRYLGFFVVFFIAFVIVGAITAALGPLGWIVSAFLSVLVGIFFYRTIGLLYDNAAGVNMQPPLSSPSPSPSPTTPTPTPPPQPV